LKSPYDLFFEKQYNNHPWYKEYNTLVEAWNEKYYALTSEEKRRLQLEEDNIAIDDVLYLARSIMSQADIKQLYINHAERKKIDYEVRLPPDEASIMSEYASYISLRQGKVPYPILYICASYLMWRYLDGEIASIDGDEARNLLLKIKPFAK